MKIEAQRWIDRYLGVPILGALSLFDRLRSPPRARPPTAILIILLSEMGSMVCAQPMILDLQQRYPGVRLHVLLLRKNRGVVELLKLFDPDAVVTIDDRSLTAFLRSSWQAVRKLRRAKIDVVIDCELFARISAIFSWLSGAPVRVGFHRMTQEGLYRGSVVNRPVPYNPYRHISSQFLVLAGSIESVAVPVSKNAEVLERPSIKKLELSSARVAEAGLRLKADFPALVGRRLVMLYPGSGILPIRGWPIERFKGCARALVEDGYAVAIIGLPEDSTLAEGIVAAAGSPHCVNLAGYTRSLADLVELFHHAELLISNDGGPGHFAALTPLPVISLFGPETPDLYAPLCERGIALYRRLPCSPCLTAYNHRNTPCDGNNVCLQSIELVDVIRAARQILQEDLK